jgi:hypothetical protein
MTISISLIIVGFVKEQLGDVDAFSAKDLPSEYAHQSLRDVVVEIAWWTSCLIIA